MTDDLFLLRRVEAWPELHGVLQWICLTVEYSSRLWRKGCGKDGVTPFPDLLGQLSNNVGVIESVRHLIFTSLPFSMVPCAYHVCGLG